eukprot:scaffold19717_cov60-Phaeocystis_antarctica.AAC.1
MLASDQPAVPPVCKPRLGEEHERAEAHLVAERSRLVVDVESPQVVDRAARPRVGILAATVKEHRQALGKGQHGPDQVVGAHLLDSINAGFARPVDTAPAGHHVLVHKDLANELGLVRRRKDVRARLGVGRLQEALRCRVPRHVHPEHVGNRLKVEAAPQKHLHGAVVRAEGEAGVGRHIDEKLRHSQERLLKVLAGHPRLPAWLGAVRRRRGLLLGIKRALNVCWGVPLDRYQTTRQIDGPVAEPLVLVRRKVHVSSLALAEEALGEEVGGRVGSDTAEREQQRGDAGKPEHAAPLSLAGRSLPAVILAKFVQFAYDDASVEYT